MNERIKSIAIMGSPKLNVFTLLINLQGINYKVLVNPSLFNHKSILSQNTDQKCKVKYHLLLKKSHRK